MLEYSQEVDNFDSGEEESKGEEDSPDKLSKWPPTPKKKSTKIPNDILSSITALIKEIDNSNLLESNVLNIAIDVTASLASLFTSTNPSMRSTQICRKLGWLNKALNSHVIDLHQILKTIGNIRGDKDYRTLATDLPEIATALENLQRDTSEYLARNTTSPMNQDNGNSSTSIFSSMQPTTIPSYKPKSHASTFLSMLPHK